MGVERGVTGKEGEGASQRTQIEDSRAQTMGWGLTVGVGAGGAGESNGKNGGISSYVCSLFRKLKSYFKK